MGVMMLEVFGRVNTESERVLRELVDADWSAHAGSLDWSCRQTLDHVIDCVFSYTMQLAARAASGFLPFNELHAAAAASADELLVGFRAVAQMFYDVARNAPPGAVASDGVLLLSVDDWCARAAYEVALHTYDIATGLGAPWRLPDDLSRAIVASESLWMFDRTAVAVGDSPWTSLLAGSGRDAIG
jgi:uncharacterized protein (TIGR03083 family)